MTRTVSNGRSAVKGPLSERVILGHSAQMSGTALAFPWRCAILVADTKRLCPLGEGISRDPGEHQFWEGVRVHGLSPLLRAPGGIQTRGVQNHHYGFVTNRRWHFHPERGRRALVVTALRRYADEA